MITKFDDRNLVRETFLLVYLFLRSQTCSLCKHGGSGLCAFTADREQASSGFTSSIQKIHPSIIFPTFPDWGQSFILVRMFLDGERKQTRLSATSLAISVLVTFNACNCCKGVSVKSDF